MGASPAFSGVHGKQLWEEHNRAPTCSASSIVKRSFNGKVQRSNKTCCNLEDETGVLFLSSSLRKAARLEVKKKKLTLETCF